MITTRKVILFSFSILLLGGSLLPGITRSNGGDERYVDGILVGLTTAPIAPFVGERVGMLISFRDAERQQYITTVPQAKILIEAFIVEGYEGGDIIFENDFADSSSGSFNADYNFEKEGLYDIHVVFTTLEGIERDVGYLRQIRTGFPIQTESFLDRFLIETLGLISGLSFAAGYLIARRGKILPIFRKK